LSYAVFDTSALVKLLVHDEAGFEATMMLWEASDPPVCSRLAYVEARAALATAVRNHRLDGYQRRAARRRLDRLWSQALVVEVTESVANGAAELVDRHPLRGYDAIHIATALVAEASSLVTFDKRQAQAAAAEGLVTFE
jgi:predicted nucleic acid-binding protein